MPEITFNRLVEIASDIIDGVVYVPVNTLEVTSISYSKVQRACCYIIESLYINGGVDAIHGFSASSQGGESLGDYSYSSKVDSQSQGSAARYGDIRVPALAMPLLNAAGLIPRWVYAGTVIDDGH